MAIGKSVKRVDAVAKVTGRARYTDDFFIPGMLVAKYLRSTIAHGLVKKINSSKAKRLAGVEAVFTYADVPHTPFATAGHPYSLDPAHRDVEDRLLLTQHVRYWGDEIAIVVAENSLVLQEAFNLIEVDYEAYEPLVTTQAALAQGAREIHAGSKNVIGESHYAVGEKMDAALTGADVVLEGEYRTQMCQHCHIENHVAYAYMDDLEHIVVVSSTQIPHIARRIVGEALGLPWGRIRIIKPYIGGGFGAKQDVILEPMVAFLTLKLGGRPVKIDLSREECMIGTRTRHPFEVKMRAGVNKDGTLLALDMDALSNTGAYASHGHSVAGAAGAKSRLLYPRAAMHYHAKTVYTNIPAAGAMRAYGTPQLIFAVDCMIEEAARKIVMDPVEFRMKNVARQGDTDPLTGERFESCGLVECLQKGKELIRWDEKRATRPKKQTGAVRRGLGVACFSYASGTYPVCLEIAGARIILNQDASLHIQVGATEIGQGLDTIVAQMAAETVGIPYDHVHVVSTQDTDVAPFDTGAYASRQAYVASNAVFRAARELKAKILEHAGRISGILGGELDILNGEIIHLKDPFRKVLSLKEVALDAYYDKERGGQLTADVSHKTCTNAPTFGCTFVEVEVDVPLCKVTIKEIYNVHDSGVILHPVMARGQVHGGVAMGIAAGLYEEMLIDPESGYIYNNNFLDYKIPTVVDVPDIGCDFVETYEPTSGYGNKSLGEPPIISPPPAIRNAIWDATDVRINELPMTPHLLFTSFNKAGLL
ncbi:MAG: xanthine dehydrogenase molybdenum-binding subunit XdhA [Deltaproteobacteria bacterium]|jgi:xanthine dehydrogenase molybdenum-binding subunit|nr:xanthine dehydrogenase molybdenum-binding subunit XdhA [Deltaproteobacteria bacterium]